MSRLIVEVKSSDGQVQTFDAPGYNVWMRANESGFVYVMVTDKELEKALAIFFQPISAKFIEVTETPK